LVGWLVVWLYGWLVAVSGCISFTVTDSMFRVYYVWPHVSHHCNEISWKLYYHHYIEKIWQGV